jgi:hypothetical protein
VATVRYAQLMLQYDPLQEVAHRTLMTAYCAMGDRSAAIRQYQQCVQVLDDELGVEPLEETRHLYDEILQGRGIGVIEVTPATPAPQSPAQTDLQWVPLVGRDRELAEIAAEWRICQDNHSRLVLVTGPAGMGKTRLVEEATRRIPGPGVTVITGNCYAMEAGTPYQLISDLMRKAAPRIQTQLSSATRADLAQLVPALQTSSRTETLARVSGNLPDASIRLQEAVTQVIRLLAAPGEGLWLVTEDLHWADPASLACLNHALRRCNDLPLMVLATLRDEEVSYDSPLLDWPTNSVHAPAPTTLIQLSALPVEQLERLLVQLVQHDVARFVPLLHHETAGNPFFVVETLRALMDRGVLQADVEGHWTLRMETLPGSDDLPMSEAAVQMIRGRIRRLSRPAQEVLTVASVVEHDIDERLLSRMVDPSLSVDLALDEILRAFILAEAAPGLYQFAHIKVREILYADTSAPRRRFLHRRAAEAIGASGSRETLPAISKLAYHYAQAREWTQALIHAWRAAQTALAAGAMAEANRYAEGAQTILDIHADELNELPEPLAVIRFDLMALRAEFRRRAATAGLYYPPDLLEAIERLLPGVDDSRRARAALMQANQRLGQGDLAGARDAAERGRRLYADLHDIWGELDATQHEIDIAYCAGDMVTMRRLLDELRSLGLSFEPSDIRQTLALNEMRLAIYEGDWVAVLRRAQELSAQETEIDPAVAWRSLSHVGLAYLKLGSHSEAYAVARQAVAASEESNVLGLGARVLLARLELLRGGLDEARDILLGLLETPDPLIGEAEVVAPALALVRCNIAAGDPGGAKQWAQRAAQAMSRVRLPILFPLSQIAWTLIYLAEGRYEEAHKRLRYPLEVMLLLEDTSPQEIYALRAAAARGLGDHTKAAEWLQRAWVVIQQQADSISEPRYRQSFLEQVPLHQFVERARSDPDWAPEDMLGLQSRLEDWAI